MVVGKIVPPHAIIEREPARDLPGVLEEEGGCVLAVLHRIRRTHAGVVHQAKKEAGVGETNGAAGEALTVSRRKAGLIGCEIVDALAAVGVMVLEYVDSEFPTSFDGVITPYPRHTCH